MKMLLIVLCIAAGSGILGAGLYKVLAHPAPAADDARLNSDFARILGFYANESNEGYRRARQVLLRHADALKNSVAYHLDMALLDLGESDHCVEDQERVDPTRVQNAVFDGLVKSAQEHLERARKLAPHDEAVAYNLGRTYSKLAPDAPDPDKLRKIADQLIRPLTRLAHPDPAALWFYAKIKDAFSDDQGVFDACDKIVKLGPDAVVPAMYRSALYMRATEMMRLPGRAEEGKKELEEFRKKYPDRDKPPPGADEQGRYTVLRPLVPVLQTEADPRDMKWILATRRTGIPAVGSHPFFLAPDLDGDGARDLVMDTKEGTRIFRNRRNATFQDMTEDAGLPDDLDATAAAAGDLDHDGLPDLVFATPQGLRLFRNVSNPQESARWRFREVKVPEFAGGTGLEATKCLLLWDFDGDGYLDVFCGGDPNRLFRTKVTRTAEGGVSFSFTDVAPAVGVTEPPATAALVMDVNGDDAVDLCVTSKKGNAWFEKRSAEKLVRHALPEGEGLEAGDVDNDLREELRVGGTVYKWSGGAFRKIAERPALFDGDGDGVLDSEPFANVALKGRVLGCVAADFNRDGDTDLLVLTPASLDFYLGKSDRPAAWLEVRAKGLHSNTTGVGAMVRLYAGDLRIGAMCRDGWIRFGLGQRTRIDSVLFHWDSPKNVRQGLDTPTLDDAITVEERDVITGTW